MSVIYVIYAILGISVIIFIHELGHFLAAKKVGVRVERFSVGFDPTVFGVRLRFFAFRRGETEYIVGMIPFGGYVKLAGETQLDAETGKTEPQPDWLVSKSPGARALVFAAGAAFNIVSAFFFFALAFNIGVSFFTTDIGWVEQDSPAWEAGFRPGDRITAIDGEPTSEYMELMMAVAFADRGKQLEIEYESGTGENRTTVVTPEWNEVRGIQTIGVQHGLDPKVVAVTRKSAAEKAGVQSGDLLTGARLGAIELTSTPSFDAMLQALREYKVVHQGAPIELRVKSADGNEAWRTLEFDAREETENKLGIAAMHPACIVEAVRGSSPLAGRLGAGDRILRVNGDAILSFDIVTLADLASAGRADWTITVERQNRSEEEITLPRADVINALAVGDLDFARPGEIGPIEAGSALAAAGFREGDIVWRVGDRIVGSVDRISDALAATPGEMVAVGIIRDGARLEKPLEVPRQTLRELAAKPDGDGSPWQRTPLVRVATASPAARAGLVTGSRVTRIGERPIASWTDVLEVVSSTKKGSEITVAWVTPEGSERAATATLEKETYIPLGLELQPRQAIVQAGLLESTVLGVQRVKIISQQVFLTLKGLLKRQVEAKNLSGPVGIVHIMHRISEYGIGTLIYFMALISVNLGILNLLPIPILDGGHLLFLLIEKIKGSPVDIRIQEAATAVAFFLIIGLALFVTYHDLRRLIGF